MKKLTSLMYILQLIQTYDAVTVPRSPVTSPPGSDVTLSCSFSYKAGADLTRVVVTWVRPPADHVVHSFYYGRDQLALQNETYRSRTQLFPEQLSVGNASLRLKQVRGEDEGWYTCAVTNQVENTKGDVRLIVAAEFSEPRLVITDRPDSPDKALLSCISTGYPSASVKWLNESGYDITESSRTSQFLARDGLVEITSHILLSRDANYTCVLTHNRLKQTLKKTITLTKKDFSSRSSIMWVVSSLLTVVLVTLITIAIYLLFKHRRGTSTPTDTACVRACR
ncbi:CD276 antigen-like isoform X2 [Acipenser ruthenus]|uniref:CD276 antigen-like isoform X2 n=1 Tax=Acipenser ruthenus TaxID=7906 RepID=UPI00274153E9|nr:CD276 antigen-like isoform X2 [Acipenser ruthenus]